MLIYFPVDLWWSASTVWDCVLYQILWLCVAHCSFMARSLKCGRDSLATWSGDWLSTWLIHYLLSPPLATFFRTLQWCHISYYYCYCMYVSLSEPSSLEDWMQINSHLCVNCFDLLCVSVTDIRNRFVSITRSFSMVWLMRLGRTTYVLQVSLPFIFTLQLQMVFVVI